MGKLIIDTVTGTILNAEGCYVLDDTDWTSDDFTDREIAELAAKSGKSLMKIGEDTGWGDNAYKYTVSFSPETIKQETELWLNSGMHEDDDPQLAELVWAKEEATLEQLQNIAELAMGGENIWEYFYSNMTEAISEAYEMKEAK